MPYKLAILLLLMLLWPPIGLAQQQKPQTLAAAVRVNGAVITVEQLDREFFTQFHVNFATVTHQAKAKEARRQLLERMINDELLRQEATARGLKVLPAEIDKALTDLSSHFPSEAEFNQTLSKRGLGSQELRRRIEIALLNQRLLAQEVEAKATVSDREIQSFYQQHRKEYRQPERLRIRHILLKLAPGASTAEEKRVKELAADLRARIRRGEDFVQLAKRHSQEPSSSQGGDVGYVERGKITRPFEEALFALKVGEVSEPIKTAAGLHLIKVEERQPERSLALREVKDRVQADLRGTKAAAILKDYLGRLRAKSKVAVLLSP